MGNKKKSERRQKPGSRNRSADPPIRGSGKIGGRWGTAPRGVPRVPQTPPGALFGAPPEGFQAPPAVNPLGWLGIKPRVESSEPGATPRRALTPSRKSCRAAIRPWLAFFLHPRSTCLMMGEADLAPTRPCPPCCPSGSGLRPQPPEAPEVTLMRTRKVLLAAVLALLPAPAPGQSPGRPADPGFFESKVRPVLVAHCYACHSQQTAKPKGDLRLDQLPLDFADEAARERWLAVLKRVQAGEMPPKSRPRPPQADVRLLSDWISGRAEAAAADRRAQGRVVLRRLNRVEYENTVRDLLGVDADLKELLALDSARDGFDNVGAALHVSSFAMERYLEAAPPRNQPSWSLSIIWRRAAPSASPRTGWPRPRPWTRSGRTSTTAPAWRSSGSRWRGRCTTPGRRPATAASSATCRRRGRRCRTSLTASRSSRRMPRRTPSACCATSPAGPSAGRSPTPTSSRSSPWSRPSWPRSAPSSRRYAPACWPR
jgi:hypothetical protein